MSDLMQYWPLLTGGAGALATLAWLVKTLRRVANVIQQLLSLLTPNGGHSLADKINQMHAMTTDAHARLAEHNERLSTLERALLLQAAYNKTHDGEEKAG